MRKLVLATAAVLMLVSAGSAAWLQFRMTQPLQIALHFQPFVGAEPLLLNDARYANPGGEGRFAVRDFQVFISNIRLVADAGAYTEPDSYHLLRFDTADAGYAIVLREVPRRDYRRIEFAIGVDAAANGAITVRGDLDPNGRMAWTWDVGYKFVLVEGTLLRGDTRSALVYHVGFDENYTPLSFPVDGERIEARNATLDFRVDLLRMFQGSATVDMAALPTVKFDRADAALLRSNFASMITVVPRSRAAHP
jgi:hypothetical protein